MESSHRALMTVAVAAALALALLAPAGPAHAQSTVGIDVAGHFTTFVNGAVGIGSESEVVEQKITDPTSGEPIIRKLPGRLKILDITAQRGLTTNTALADWRKLVEDGQITSARATMTVTAYDHAGTPLAVWIGANCWPSRIENLVPDPASGLPLEKLVVVCEGLERTQ